MDLRSFLDRMGVQYAWRHHDPAYTAQDLATREHISGKKVIKPVVVEADGQFVLCALPATCYIDMESLREQLHARAARLADEPQFERIFQGCELGAEPPIGLLYGIPTVLDDSVTQLDAITFQACTHQDAVTMSVSDYMRLAQPTVAHFGKPRA